MRVVGLFLSLILSVNSWAGEWKFRAREHYEIHDVSVASQNYTYKGFSNTINFWYEDPFNYSLGLAVGPLLGSARIDGNAAASLGAQIQLYNLGVEFKYFFVKGLFARPALFWSHLVSDGVLERSSGWSPYVGIGYEFLWSGVGIAIEAAWRQSYLQNDIEVTSFTPSIGLHFYEMSLF